MSGQQSALRKIVSSRGIVTFEIDLLHKDLGKHRIVKGSDPHFVMRVAAMQLDNWNALWERQQALRARYNQNILLQESREEKRHYQEEQKEMASERTREATRLLESLRDTLQYTL